MSFPNANYNFNVVNEANFNSIVSNALSVAGDVSIQGNLVVGGDVSSGGDIIIGGCAISSQCTAFDLLSIDADGTDPATNPVTIRIGSGATTPAHTTNIQSVVNNIGQPATGRLSTNASRTVVAFNFSTGPSIQLDAVAGVGNAVTIGTAGDYGALNLGGRG